MITEFSGQHRFLSNFWTSPITLFGRMYPTVEHFYQAMKATTTKDHEMIRKCGTSQEAKRIARQIVLRDDWDIVKFAIMREGLLQKFAIPQLRTQLLNTGIKKLIEGNKWHDNIWGNCSCPRCHDIYGTNMLGTLLMSIRSEITLQNLRDLRG